MNPVSLTWQSSRTPKSVVHLDFALGVTGVSELIEREWTELDFESMSWHDNHVHGLRIVEGQFNTLFRRPGTGVTGCLHAKCLHAGRSAWPQAGES